MSRVQYRSPKGYNSVAGFDAEFFVARTFDLYRPNHSRHDPDLISSRNGLRMEVKSGMVDKVNLNDFQLVHGLFEGRLEGCLRNSKAKLDPVTLDLFDASRHLKRNNSCFLCFAQRNDDLSIYDLMDPARSIYLEWDALYILPAEYAFFPFAMQFAKKLELSLDQAINHLAQDACLRGLESKTSYKIRADGAYQNAFYRDALALFHEDKSLADTRFGVNRYDFFLDYYPQISLLKKKLLRGPNNIPIYAMYWQDDAKVVADLERALGTQKKIVETVSDFRTELCRQIAPHTDVADILVSREKWRPIPYVRVPKRIILELKQAKKWLLPHEDSKDIFGV